MLQAVCLLALAVIVASAPLDVAKDDAPLVRVKRDAEPEVKLQQESVVREKRTAETVIFGNHQNSARVKKAGPIPPLPIQSEPEAELDKKASVQTDVEPAEDKAASSPDVAEKAAQTADVIFPELAASNGGEDIESSLNKLVNGDYGEAEGMGDEEGEEEAKEEIDEEEAKLEELMAEAREAELERLNQAPEEEMKVVEGSGEPEIDYEMSRGFPLGQGRQPPEYYDPQFDYYNYFYGNQLEGNRQKRNVPQKETVNKENERTERSVQSAAEVKVDGVSEVNQRAERSVMPSADNMAVNAEDMSVDTVQVKNNRIKRDLAFEQDYPYPGEEFYKEDPSVEYPLPSTPDEEELTNEYLGALVQSELDPYGETTGLGGEYVEEPIYEPREEEEEEEIPYELARELELEAEEEAEEEAELVAELEAEEEAKERLAMIEYLYQQEAESGVEVPRELERYEEPEAAEEPEYEPIVYNGTPGIFIPLKSTASVSKRQYLSFVPGTRKRSSEFFPAQPDQRWNAFIQSEIEKRNQEEMYERLYRLAEALRGDEGYRK